MRSNSHLGPSWRQGGRLGPPNQPWRSKFEGFSFIFESILHQSLKLISFYFRLSIVSFSMQNMSSKFQFRHSHTHLRIHIPMQIHIHITHTHAHTHTHTDTHTFNRFLNFLPRVMARWRLCARSALDIYIKYTHSV